ncbi:hypothetical protein [Bradyrhizobium iriomotense]|nr:hypothetical protein [Bradyrhizobium iriomotense]
MQQAFQRSNLVPSGLTRPLLQSERREALVCVHRAERFPDVSIADIDDV